MGDQNIHGNRNVSNQYNNISNIYKGEVSLYSLDVDELAVEYVLAHGVVSSEKKRRWIIFVILEVLGLSLIFLGYKFFLNRGDLSLADVFNNFASALSVPIAGALFSSLLGVASVWRGAIIAKHRTSAEDLNSQRLFNIDDIAISKGVSRRVWKRTKRAAKRAAKNQ